MPTWRQAFERLAAEKEAVRERGAQSQRELERLENGESALRREYGQRGEPDLDTELPPEIPVIMEG